MKLEMFCMDCGEARANFTVAETPCIYEGEGHEWFTVDVTDYEEEVETCVSVGADPNEARHEQIVPQGAM